MRTTLVGIANHKTQLRISKSTCAKRFASFAHVDLEIWSCVLWFAMSTRVMRIPYLFIGKLVSFCVVFRDI